MLQGRALIDEIQFHIVSGQLALAMDDLECAQAHNLKADELMHINYDAICGRCCRIDCVCESYMHLEA